jgi:hypothetical protein
MDASERFTEEAALALREAIEDAGGNEVFAACRINDEGLVHEVLIAAPISSAATSSSTTTPRGPSARATPISMSPARRARRAWVPTSSTTASPRSMS